jgi:low temperature requirement protein LtrA
VARRARWAPRAGLVVILALGESVVAVGVGAAGMPLRTELLVAASLGIVVAAALWWLYFDVSAGAAERALHRRDAEGRVRAAIEAYTYLHYWAILGIVLTAVGIEEAITHVMDSDPLGAFAAGCLTTGPAMYLAGNVLSWIRLAAVVKTERLVAIAVLLTMWPIATVAPPLVALALVAAGLIALVAFESVKYAAVRSEMRAART